MNDDMQLLSIKQVCGRLNIGTWMFYRLLHEKRLTTVQIGSRRLVKPSALQAYINSLENAEFDANDY